MLGLDDNAECHLVLGPDVIVPSVLVPSKGVTTRGRPIPNLPSNLTSGRSFGYPQRQSSNEILADIEVFFFVLTVGVEIHQLGLVGMRIF